MLNESIGAEEISEDDTAQVSFQKEPEIEATAATSDAPKTSQPLHFPSGICEPCLFFWSRRWRCAKGDRCEYCHHHDFPPVGKTRPTKAVREKIQRRLYPLLQCLDAYDPSVGLVEKAWCHQRQWTENQWSNGSSWCFLVRKPVVKQQNLRRPWKQPGRRSCFVEYHVCAEGGGGGKLRNHCSVWIASLMFHNQKLVFVRKCQPWQTPTAGALGPGPSSIA